jgi:hypothetical protein
MEKRPTRERKQVEQFKPEVKEVAEFVIKPGRSSSDVGS